jgi:2-phospho-L-lactate guanylyltransferase (CobY/MobA/RfbA family)
MKATASEGPLLETAKKKAVEIAESYGGGTRFLLLTNDFLPQHQYFLSKDQFIQEVTKLRKVRNRSHFRNYTTGPAWP